MSLRDRQIKRSLESLYEGRVTGSDSGIEVRLRAFGPFFPAAFEGVIVDLQLLESGETSTVSGKISLINHSDNRGTWFHYQFIPDNPEEVKRIHFYTSLAWSCVQRFDLVFDDSYLKVTNPFAKDQAELPEFAKHLASS